MIEQINIILSKRGPKFLSLGHWSLPSETGVRKKAYTSIKSDEEWTSRVLPSEQDDIVNSLNYEGIAVIELRILPLSWQWQTACWLCHRLNSLEWLAVMVISQPQR